MFPGFHRVLDCHRGLTRGFLQIGGFSYKKFRCFAHRDSYIARARTTSVKLAGLQELFLTTPSCSPQP